MVLEQIKQALNLNDSTESNMGSNLPQEFTVAVFEEKGKPLTLKKRKLEQPKDGEVLVKVLACGVCGSDTHAQEGVTGNSFPLVPGHEIVGDVAAVPSSEQNWKVGDRVGGPWHGGHCGHCAGCKMNMNQTCDEEAINGITRDGGYAEYVTLRTEAVVRIPKEMDPVKVAPLLCAGVTVFNSVRKQNIVPGGTVAVVGLGGLGHLGLQYMNKMGYRTIAVSSSASKKDFATKLGAHDYIDGSKGPLGDQLQKLGGADLIMLTAGSPDMVKQLVPGLKRRGTLLILALMGSFEVDWMSILPGRQITAWPSGIASDSEDAIEFAQRNGIECMVESFKLEDANEALEKMSAGKIRFRGVLTP